MFYEFFYINSKHQILKAPYVGINLNAPTFGDIAVLAKGKLKKNTNKTFSFEQITERCDEKCQSDANKYLENVTALWMVERIRHRDVTGNNRYDLKFTIVPIYNDQQHKLDDNYLEERLRSHMKRTFILRDSDYPSFFQTNSDRRMDLFPTGFERSLSNIMNPNKLIQRMFGLQNTQKQKIQSDRTSRLNTGEFYMSPKIQNSPKPNFHPTFNGHAKSPIDHRVKFPDSREMTLHKSMLNLYRPKPEIYNSKNIIDYRGANDNDFVGSNDHQLTQPSNRPINVPLFTIPVEMGPIIQIAQTPYGILPVQIQPSTPTNLQPIIFQQQPDVTTFRYHPQLLGLSNPPTHQIFNVPVNFVPTNRSRQFHESERHTMTYYSEPDPVYHHQPQQSTTEAPMLPSTYSPRFNYANIVRPQFETPISTASSSQLNTFDDNEFQPITPSYDVRKYNHFRNFAKGSTTAKPEISFNDTNVTMTTSYITPTTIIDPISDKANEVNYQIVMGRPKLSTFKFDEKTTEKPVLKWIPKKQRNKLADDTSTPNSQFVPTPLPIETTTKLTTHIFRGRNRFNKRNSSSTNVKAATISPQITTKILRKKTSSATISSTQTPIVTSSSSVFPTYITPVLFTDEPITSQSFSTSISLEVNGERIFDETTTAGYELVSAGVESIDTNNTNVKLFKASVVPEKFDDLTASILNHANTLRDNKDD